MLFRSPLKKFLLISFFPLATLFAGIFVLQEDYNALMGNIINLPVLIVCMSVAVRLIYQSFLQNESYKYNIKKMSITDALTELYNRNGLSDFVNRVFVEGDKIESVAVIMIDIDFCKEYNDTYGHLQGDQ